MSFIYKPSTYLGSDALVVGTGCQYSTISSALSNASAGNTILVMPGTYTETLTIPANNLSIIAMGKPNSVIIQQANANVVDCSSYTGVQIRGCKIQVTAATTAINTVQVSTGSLTCRDCQLLMTSSEALVQASQPAVGACTGSGTLEIKFGKFTYAHTGACGGTAIKSAFTVGTGGEVDLAYMHDGVVSNSGTALVSAASADLSTTGVISMEQCKIDVTDPNATICAGLGYIGGTGSENEFLRNDLHVIATANTGYGIYAADTASTSRSFFNHIHISDTGGASYSFFVGASATVNSHFDDIIADDGHNGTGTFTAVNSPVDGQMEISGGIRSEDANTILEFLDD
jgi:hypothetical protein